MGRHMLWTWMAFWMHRDTVTRSWGPLLCHSSTTITSCCSMIMHGPMLQGSVHNSWKLKTSQFLHGQHTHQTCHPLSMFGMLWIGVYNSVFQFLPISSNFTQPLKRMAVWRGVDQHSTGHNQQLYQLYAKEMCYTAWDKWWSNQILTVFFPFEDAPQITLTLSFISKAVVVIMLEYCPVAQSPNEGYHALFQYVTVHVLESAIPSLSAI